MDHVFEGITAEQFAALDEQMQAMICQQFTALVHVCLTSANLLRNAGAGHAGAGRSARAGGLSSAERGGAVLRGALADEKAAEEAITHRLRGGGPGADLAAAARWCSWWCRCGPAGGLFRERVRRVLAGVPLLGVVGGDDIVFYREAAQVPLADLGQLGPVAREAYGQLTRREHFTPHSRADIVFRRTDVSPRASPPAEGKRGAVAPRVEAPRGLRLATLAKRRG